MSANKEIIEKIFSFFFSQGGRSSFCDTANTATLKILLENVCTTCMPYLKELLTQAQTYDPDKFLLFVGTLYDICSARVNGFCVLVEVENEKPVIFPWEQKEETNNDKIIFDSNKIYSLIFANKNPNSFVNINMCRNLDFIKECLVKTPSGQFQYLVRPAVSIAIPCNVIMSLVVNGLVLPVLSSISSKMNLEEKWKKFFETKKNKEISKCLTNVTNDYVKNVARQVGSLIIPLDDEDCDNLCLVAGISHSINSRRIFYNLTFETELISEIKKYEERYRKQKELEDLAYQQRISDELKIESRQRENSKIVMQELLTEVSHRLQFECCICQDVRQCAITTTQCNHFFHSLCLNQWRQTKNTCPMCRGPI